MFKARILADSGEYGVYSIEIELPFAPQKDVELMIGESSDWNHFRLLDACWHTVEKEFVCWAEWVCLRDLSDEELEKLLTQDGWEIDKS